MNESESAGSGSKTNSGSTGGKTLDILSYPSKWLRRSHVVRAIFTDADIPILPQIVLTLETLLDKQNTGSTEVATLLESEPVIAGRVLHLANSAYYGSGRKDVNSVSAAVSRLGIETIRGLVYSATLPELFHTSGFTFNHMQFWKHSLTVAFLSRDLVLQHDKNARESSDKAYMSGLMHDLGILLFAKAMPDHYERITVEGPDLGVDLFYVEDEVLGIDHSELSAMYVERNWKMDPEIVQAIRLHHKSPSKHPRSHPFSMELYVANAICAVYGIGNGALKNIRHENLGLLATLADLGYDMEQLERMLKMALEGVESIEGMLMRK